MTVRSLVVLVIAVVTPVLGYSQSLGDLARREESRREAIKKPAKVYTNEDLRGSFAIDNPASADLSSSSGGVPTVTGSSASPAPPPPPPDPPPPDGRKDQKFWHDRMTTARLELDRSKVYLDALQSRINALQADFINRDDPAQKMAISEDRKRAITELERLKTQMAQMARGITAIEDEARKQNVPAGWLR